MKVTAIIVNYNTADVVAACIDSLLMQADVETEIIVVDNASKDNSKSVLEAYAGKIRLLSNDENVGFGNACNQAFKEAQGEYLYLINPDAELTKPTDFQHLISRLEIKTGIGFIGTHIQSETAMEIPTDYPGQKHIKQDFGTLPGKIAYLPCTSAFISRKVYEEVQGFDEDFFVYGEAMDICLRTRKAGYKIDFYGDVTAKHTEINNKHRSGNYQRYLRRMQNLYTFYRKHYFIDEVKNLLQKDLKKARYRLISLKFIAPISTKVKDKVEHYRAVKQMATENLSHY